MHIRRPHRPSAAVVLGVLAVAIAATGTSVAATGQLVNIADGTNAAQVAKVDSSGRLNVTGSVKPSAPTTFHGQGYVSNYFTNGAQYIVISPPTGATLALTKLV